MQHKTTDKPRRRQGAPVLPDELKRTARCTLRIWVEEHAQYEAYCRTKGLKLAEFFRLAINQYMAAKKHEFEPCKEEGTPDSNYHVHMTKAEKEICVAYAQSRGCHLSELIRAAARELVSAS